eukprot:5141394-Karenia_brevis.AAC.1
MAPYDEKLNGQDLAWCESKKKKKEDFTPGCARNALPNAILHLTLRDTRTEEMALYLVIPPR